MSFSIRFVFLSSISLVLVSSAACGGRTADVTPSPDGGGAASASAGSADGSTTPPAPGQGTPSGDGGVNQLDGASTVPDPMCPGVQFVGSCGQGTVVSTRWIDYADESEVSVQFDSQNEGPSICIRNGQNVGYTKDDQGFTRQILCQQMTDVALLAKACGFSSPCP
jgi:hypothetical protein